MFPRAPLWLSTNLRTDVFAPEAIGGTYICPSEAPTPCLNQQKSE